MKIKDVIKTPVRVCPPGMRGGSSVRDSSLKIIASAYSEKTLEVAAHCINQHDALVDMVRRLRNVINHMESSPVILDNDQLIREADELLEKEK